MSGFRPVAFALALATFALLGAGRAAANCSDAYLACLDSRVVAAIQRKLTEEGSSPGPIDGRWGRQTAAALNEFLTKRSVPRSQSLSPEIVLWGLEIDYENASAEERIRFLQQIGIDDL